MKIRHIVILVIFLLINILVIMTLNIGNGKVEEDKEEKEQFVQELQAQKVVNTKEQFDVIGYGTVSSFNAVDISSEVQGKLLSENKPLKPGTKFSKGELIFRVSDRDARYNLRSRKSGFITILAQLLPDIRVDFPEEFDKWNDYVSSIKLNNDLPTLPTWQSNKEKIFIASRNILTEYFTIKSQEELLRKYRFYAPYNCVITDVYVSEHSVVNPGARIVRIAQLGNFEIAVPLPVSSLSAIDVGTAAHIYSTEGELKGEGTVVRISEVIDQSTQSINVYLKAKPVESKKFIEGEYLKVEIDESGEYSGIRLPARAVNEGSVYVFTIQDSSLVSKKVSVLNKNESGLFISGLEDGEIVITQEILNTSDSLKYGVVLK